MSIPTNDEINGFINALQLCITSQIMSWKWVDHTKQDSILIIFTSHRSKLDKLTKLVGGTWRTSADGLCEYKINDLQTLDFAQITHFLLLTRLKEEAILKLAEQDSHYRPFAERLGLVKNHPFPTDTLSGVRDVIFDMITKKEMTLKVVSQKSGLTQVALSNFKAGGDIRLSSLLKIIKVLGLKLILD